MVCSVLNHSQSILLKLTDLQDEHSACAETSIAGQAVHAGHGGDVREARYRQDDDGMVQCDAALWVVWSIHSAATSSFSRAAEPVQPFELTRNTWT